MVPAVLCPSPQLFKAAETAHLPGLLQALFVSALVYSASITMNVNIKVQIKALTLVMVALVSHVGTEFGLDLVRCSPSPVSDWGENLSEQAFPMTVMSPPL
jgi:hypothetical protein